MNSVTNIVACPRCEVFLRPPFITCPNDHFLCKHCKLHIDADTKQVIESTECGNEERSMAILNKCLRNVSDSCQNGCGYRDNIVDLATHEDTCLSITKCAINACPWIGRLPKLVEHVEDNHPENLVDLVDVENTFQLDFEHPILLLTQLNKNNPDNHIYWIRLYKNEDSQYVMMQHQGHTGQNSVPPIEFAKLSISSKDTKVPITKSDGEDILNNEFFKNKATKLSTLNDEKFVIRIKDPSPITRKFLESNLECFICLAIMSAPIRLCVSGHSICASCSVRINNKCPKCQYALSSAGRNYALEQIAENLLLDKKNIHKKNNIHCHFPAISCVYVDWGCTFTSTTNIISHVRVCEFETITCFLDKNCMWNGSYKNMASHIKQHYDISYFNRVYRYTFFPQTCYSFHDENFICRFSTTENSIFFGHLKLITKAEYDFKIELINNATGVRKLIIGPCQPIGKQLPSDLKKYVLEKNFIKNGEPFFMIVCISPKYD